MELFKIDPGLALWTWIAFGVMYLILAKYVFPHLMANLKNREDTIAKSVDHAAHIKKRLVEIDKERAEVIKQTKIEASDLLRETRLQAEVVRKDLIEKAEAEGRAIVARAKAKISDEREAAIASLKQDLADFVCDTSEKVIGESFIGKQDREWVTTLVEETL